MYGMFSCGPNPTFQSKRSQVAIRCHFFDFVDFGDDLPSIKLLQLEHSLGLSTVINEETPGLGELRAVDAEANQTQSAVVSRPQSLDLCIKSELVCVEFHHAIRREENFESAEDLKAALQNDEQVSRDTFKQLFEHQRRSTKSILGQ